MPLPSIHEVEACHTCGSREGFYIKSRVSGVAQINYSFDGSGSCNTGMYHSVKHNDGKYAYCQNCCTTIGVWDEHSKKVVPYRVNMTSAAN